MLPSDGGHAHCMMLTAVRYNAISNLFNLLLIFCLLFYKIKPVLPDDVHRSANWLRSAGWLGRFAEDKRVAGDENRVCGICFCRLFSSSSMSRKAISYHFSGRWPTTGWQLSRPNKLPAKGKNTPMKLGRSTLSVPGHLAKMHTRASQSTADAILFDGKGAIHPRQIDIINQTFSPAKEDVDRVMKVLYACETVKTKGHGAAAIEGRMIDGVAVRMVRQLKDRAEYLGRLNAGEDE